MSENNNLTMILGVGGAGNQVAFQSSKEYFPAIAMNSTAKDMTEIIESDSCHTILLSEDGCGKDRDIAKELIKENYKSIIEQVMDMISYYEEDDKRIKRLIVTGAINSGTGAGAIPITIDLLRRHFKKIKRHIEIIAAPYSPDDLSVRSMTNALETMKELIRLGIPYLPIDNSACTISSPQAKYTALNNALIQKFKVIRGDYFKYSAMGNIDEKDMTKLFTVPGMMKIGFASKLKNDMSDKIEDILINSIKNDYGITMQPDKIVRKIGIILNITEEMMESLDRTYPKLREYFGTLIDVFENITIAEKEADSYVGIILSGLSDPDYKLESMKDIVDEHKESLVKANAVKSAVNSINDDISWFKEMEKDQSTEDEDDGEIEDMFGDY